MQPVAMTSYRAEFPITECCAFLSHAAISPLSRRAAEAVRKHLEQVTHEPFEHYFGNVIAIFQDTRERLTALINAAGPEEIALMPNTAAGLNTVAASLPLQTGDNVLILDGDYPANVYPWMNLAYRGVLTKVVPQHDGGLDLKVLEQRIDGRTRVIALSTVMFATGFRNDIEAVGRLCHERGISFVVDGIQSLGAFPLDVQSSHIDFLAAGSQKWLLSAPGSGFLYCRRERLDDLVPGAYVGAASVVDSMNYLDYNLTYPRSAERFHLGTPNILGIVALHATLELLQEVGIPRIGEHILELIEVLINDLQGRGYELAASTRPEHRSGIVVARIPDAETVCRRLSEQGVVVTARGGGVRIAPHFYNTREEVLRVGELLDPILRP
ncbi:MAG: aminotransferase class V-fold PLP-dependent enzyme [Chloroflexaceae bacterium]|nr:aminotransferase class V-fold PLP-dependent enzyme [Chloroflexaceae bacterium]